MMIKKINKSRYKTARGFLIFWCLFIGLGAVMGSMAMLIKPDGSILHMQEMLPYFQKLPFSELLFQNYLFSGIALLIVNGLTNLTAAILIMRNKRIGLVLGGMFGVTLMLWICIQFYMFPMNFMSTIYFVFGFCQAVTGYAAWIFRKQEEFVIYEDAYRSIGSQGNELVVFFSRMGYTQKIAMEVANEKGADLYEVVSTEHTENTSGFWWCGRFAMHRWAMPIENVSADFSKYDHITICSPIWAFAICGPIRSFCQQAQGKIKSADLILVHHNRTKYVSAAHEVEQLLGVKLSNCRDVVCRMGYYS